MPEVCTAKGVGILMIVTVMGGSGSGKSAYAEAAAVSLAGGEPLYYLATMQVYDEEGERKAARHRTLRAGKGFITLEQPSNITEALTRIETGNSTVLLECMSNLAANEMFSEAGQRPEEETASKISEEIRRLAGGLKHLIVVTNNVFEDGIEYDAATMSYIRALGRVNGMLAAVSDAVIEVVAGIPVPVKLEAAAGSRHHILLSAEAFRGRKEGA
ncbi:adenosylcobinamide kinase/adenosylcobinamide-phosphate guanylyltransferase [Anaerotaenia torta]|uniref:bifunctional adenosylcobinamide kinase/adenosylcobinamide-phosphate guanylyltransferase n=1 Tax=Anaerotaenia torta TaxID=433293 RepID=UPI003D200C13